jgi:beta-lactamase regulating signal transducer with metallopeptidase domain
MSRSHALVLAGSFALTYLAHSTALFGLVWLCERTGRLRSLALREALWRVVLFGALFTAAWPFVAPAKLSKEPFFGRVTLPLVRDPLPDWKTEDAAILAPADSASFRAQETALESALPARNVLPAPALTIPAHPGTSPRSAFQALPLRALALALAASVLLLALLAPALQLRLWLGRRTPVGAGPLFDEVETLRRRAGFKRAIRLSTSSRISGPIAFGLFRPEICLPTRALVALEPELGRAMLAHELMHLARLDPLWLALGEVARRLLFFQPLARAAHRRLIHLAELACDRGAVQLTGDRLALARSLAEVATWIQGRRPRALCAMARTRSRLEERVHSLLEARDERERGPWGLIGPMFAAAAALALPTLAFERVRAPEPTTPFTALQRDHEQIEHSLGDLRARLAELSGHVLTEEEEACALALSSRALELAQSLGELDLQITEHARRAPAVPDSP